MLNYKAPLRDMRFVMNEVFDYPAHYRARARCVRSSLARQQSGAFCASLS